MATTFEYGRILQTEYYDKIKSFCQENLPNIGTYTFMFDKFAEDNNYSFAIALNEDNEVIGTAFDYPALSSKYLKEHSDLNQFLSGNSIPLDNCVYAAGVFIHPDYRGSNLLDALSVYKSEVSISDGYTHSILFGYNSQEVYDYSVRIGFTIHTSCTDYQGREIMLRKLEDYSVALNGNWG